MKNAGRKFVKKKYVVPVFVFYYCFHYHKYDYDDDECCLNPSKKK